MVPYQQQHQQQQKEQLYQQYQHQQQNQQYQQQHQQQQEEQRYQQQQPRTCPNNILLQATLERGGGRGLCLVTEKAVAAARWRHADEVVATPTQRRHVARQRGLTSSAHRGGRDDAFRLLEHVATSSWAKSFGRLRRSELAAAVRKHN
ncbi:unnamed protein product [Lampetra fluviatilis]